MDTKARINHLIEARQKGWTERTTALLDAQDKAILLSEVIRLRALVSHLPETADKNPEDREPIVPGRRYWVDVLTDESRWFEPFICDGILNGHVVGECVVNEGLEVDDDPSHIFSRHPETGEAAESEGAG